MLLALHSNKLVNNAYLLPTDPKKQPNLRANVALGVLFAFLANTIGPVPVFAQKFSVNQLPVPGTMVGESAVFAPLALKGLVVNPQKPLEFQFIVDTGRGPQDSASVKTQANQLVKYFLAGLTIPEGDLWVNLSPYEKNRMVPEALGQTDLGRDLLAQDYILKQLTASLIYPEKDLGKEFWSRVYAKAQQQFGTTNVPVNTFNKVWILPDQAQVFEHGSAAYVTKATLKVMLDEDYTALQKHVAVRNGTDSIGSQIVRQIILPEITKEVNMGKNFAPLRQIYQALILAKWYKETIQNGLLDAVYTNKNKVAGVNLNDPSVKEQIYNRYLQAYKKGAFNYIKEDPTPDGQVVPRKYFSGGFTEMGMILNRDGAMSAVQVNGRAAAFDVNLQDEAMNTGVKEAKTGNNEMRIFEIIDPSTGKVSWGRSVIYGPGQEPNGLPISLSRHVNSDGRISLIYPFSFQQEARFFKKEGKLKFDMLHVLELLIASWGQTHVPHTHLIQKNTNVSLFEFDGKEYKQKPARVKYFEGALPNDFFNSSEKETIIIKNPIEGQMAMTEGIKTCVGLGFKATTKTGDTYIGVSHLLRLSDSEVDQLDEQIQALINIMPKDITDLKVALDLHKFGGEFQFQKVGRLIQALEAKYPFVSFIHGEPRDDEDSVSTMVVHPEGWARFVYESNGPMVKTVVQNWNGEYSNYDEAMVERAGAEKSRDGAMKGENEEVHLDNSSYMSKKRADEIFNILEGLEKNDRFAFLDICDAVENSKHQLFIEGWQAESRAVAVQYLFFKEKDFFEDQYQLLKDVGDVIESSIRGKGLLRALDREFYAEEDDWAMMTPGQADNRLAIVKRIASIISISPRMPMHLHGDQNRELGVKNYVFVDGNEAKFEVKGETSLQSLNTIYFSKHNRRNMGNAIRKFERQNGITGDVEQRVLEQGEHKTWEELSKGHNFYHLIVLNDGSGILYLVPDEAMAGFGGEKSRDGAMIIGDKQTKNEYQIAYNRMIKNKYPFCTISFKNFVIDRQAWASLVRADVDKVIYGAAGADLTNVFFSTEAKTVYMVSADDVSLEYLKAYIMKDWDSPKGKEQQSVYASFKYYSGFAHIWDVYKNFDWASGIVAELKTLGLQKEDLRFEKAEDGRPSLTFDLDLGNGIKEKRNIVFIRADLANRQPLKIADNQILKYLQTTKISRWTFKFFESPGLQPFNEIPLGQVDGYYQRASGQFGWLLTFYLKSIIERIKPNGFLILNNPAIFYRQLISDNFEEVNPYKNQKIRVLSFPYAAYGNILRVFINKTEDGAMTSEKPLMLSDHPIEFKKFQEILDDLKSMNKLGPTYQIYEITDGLPEIAQLRKLVDLHFEIDLVLLDDASNGRRWMLEVGEVDGTAQEKELFEYYRQGRVLVDIHVHPKANIGEDYLGNDMNLPSLDDLNFYVAYSNYSLILAENGVSFIKAPTTNPLTGKPMLDFRNNFYKRFAQWGKQKHGEKSFESPEKRYQEFMNYCGVVYEFLGWNYSDEIRRRLISQVDGEENPLLKRDVPMRIFQSDFFIANRYKYILGNNYDNTASVEREISLAYAYGPRKFSTRHPTQEDFFDVLPWKLDYKQRILLIDTYNKIHPEEPLIFDTAMSVVARNKLDEQIRGFNREAVNFVYQQLARHYPKEDIDALRLRTLSWSKEDFDPGFLLKESKILQQAYDDYKKWRKGVKGASDYFGYFDEVDVILKLKNLLPIIVLIDKHGKYNVLDGNRRLLAAIIRSDKKINAFVGRELQTRGTVKKGRRSVKAIPGVGRMRATRDRAMNVRPVKLIVPTPIGPQNQLPLSMDIGNKKFITLDLNGSTVLNFIVERRGKNDFYVNAKPFHEMTMESKDKKLRVHLSISNQKIIICNLSTQIIVLLEDCYVDLPHNKAVQLLISDSDPQSNTIIDIIVRKEGRSLIATIEGKENKEKLVQTIKKDKLEVVFNDTPDGFWIGNVSRTSNILIQVAKRFNLAMTSTQGVLFKGGIDLNKINVKRTGKTINIQFDPAQLNELEHSDFRGFTPVITGFRYIQSPFPLLGINAPAKEIEELAEKPKNELLALRRF